jgi:hypothetical protein
MPSASRRSSAAASVRSPISLLSGRVTNHLKRSEHG